MAKAQMIRNSCNNGDVNYHNLNESMPRQQKELPDGHSKQLRKPAPNSNAHQAEQQILAGTPAKPTPIPEIVAALRTVTPLDGLTEEEYTWLATHGNERIGDDRALIFREGDPADNSELHPERRGPGRRRSSGPIALFIGRAGQMTGKLPFSRMKSYGGDGYAVGPTWALDIDQSLFPEMLAAIPSMAQRCVSVLLDRVREVTRMEQQAEKLTALGKLAANLAHELNNPASAAQRSAASLFGELREYGEQKYRLGNLCLSDQEIEGTAPGSRTPAPACPPTPTLQGPQSPLAATRPRRGHRPLARGHNVPEPWTIAPALSETNLPIDLLDELAAVTRPEVLPVAARHRRQLPARRAHGRDRRRLHRPHLRPHQRHQGLLLHGSGAHSGRRSCAVA